MKFNCRFVLLCIVLFISRSSVVLSFRFRCVVHFELTFVYDGNYYAEFLFFFSRIVEREIPIVYSFVPAPFDEKLFLP